MTQTTHAERLSINMTTVLEEWVSTMRTDFKYIPGERHKRPRVHHPYDHPFEESMRVLAQWNASRGKNNANSNDLKPKHYSP
jgi:hypothetical protein